MPLKLHLITVILALAITAITILVPRVFTSMQGLVNLNIFLGYLTLLFWIAYNCYYFAPNNFSWSVSLPLHLCDLTGLIAALSLILNRRLYKALLYFWGLGLTTQAFIFPIGEQDPSRLHYWFFWGLHILIFMCSIFDLSINKFRPNFSDLETTMKCSFLYVIFILPLNMTFGWNYGYIGNPSYALPSIIYSLGPWPHRLPLMIALAVIAQLFLLFPWALYSQRQNG